MPQINRRSFLHVLGAASLAPALPALATARAASGGATPAKLLWASLHAQAGSAQNFRGLTRSMGISARASQGIQAKVSGARALALHAAAHRGRPLATQARASVAPKPPKHQAGKLRKSVAQYFQDAEKTDDTQHALTDPQIDQPEQPDK